MGRISIDSLMIANLFKVNLKTQDTAKALYPVSFGVPY